MGRSSNGGSNKAPRWSSHRIEKLKGLLATMHMAEAAREMGVTRCSVIGIAYRHNLVKPVRAQGGDNNGAVVMIEGDGSRHLREKLAERTRELLRPLEQAERAIREQQLDRSRRAA
jgi:hypothetical protein